MDKILFIKRYGYDKWDMSLEDWREWYDLNQQESKGKARIWRSQHPDIVKQKNREIWSAGGKYYAKNILYNKTGLRRERNKIRNIDSVRFRNFKRIIAPNSIIHHQWIPGTSNFSGSALVEKKAHQYGFIDVIQILDGEITVLTEEELK